MKKTMGFLMGVLMLLSFAGVPAFADHDCKGGRCPMKEMSCPHGKCEDKGECPIAAKLMKKAGFFLSNKAELELTDEQVSQIKALKMATKKAMIRAKAEMEIFEMDLLDRMSQPVLDVEGLNAQIDQASAGWGASAKATLADYVKLKAVLSDKQMAKAKEIWVKNEK